MILMKAYTAKIMTIIIIRHVRNYFHFYSNNKYALEIVIKKFTMRFHLRIANLNF